MKRILLLSLAILITLMSQAEVSKTVNITTAGTLSTTLTATELSTVTNLTVTGTIDARDFKTLRSYMAALSVLDLSGVSIAAYTGIDGTVGSNTVFPINTIPQNALIPIPPYTVNVLTSITLPSSITSIGNSALGGLTGLTSITIPSSVTSIESGAFYNCTNLKTIYCLNTIPPILGKTCFYGATSITNVYVPTDAAVTAYKATAYWIAYFPGDIIKAGTPSAVPTLADSNVKVYTTQSSIIVEGTSVGETVSVYNLIGVQLQTLQSKGERLTIPVEHNAVYLVKTANKTVKVKL